MAPPAAVTSESPWPRRARRGLLLVVVTTGFWLTSTDPFTAVFFGCYAAIGAFLVDRRPGNVIGWLTLAIAFGFVGVTSRPGWVYEVETLRDGSAPFDEFLWAWLQGWAVYATFTGFIALMVLFPEGRLPDGRTGRLAQALLGAAVVITILVATGPVVSFSPDGSLPIEIPNRLGVLAALPIWGFIDSPALIALFLVALVVGIASIFIRFRRSTGILRLQLRWLVAALTFLVAAVTFGVASDAIAPALSGMGWIPAVVAYPTVPAAIAVAVLRHRLYDIDTVINRTLVYGLLTAVLAGVSAVVITIGKDVFVDVLGPGSDFSIVLATLIVVTAFEPVKKRIQTVVDLRFKEVHDPVEVLDEFVELVRSQVAAPDPERTIARFLDVTVSAYRGAGGEIRWSGDGREVTVHRDAGVTPEDIAGSKVLAAQASSGALTASIAVIAPAIPGGDEAVRGALEEVLGQLRLAG